MCLLTFFPDDVLPDVDALFNGAHVNNDGHGFAIVTGRRIIVRHGFNATHLIDDFARVRRAHPSGPALFHSRFGTHGTVDKANCHPFRLGGDQHTVIAHNGILPKSVQPAKGDPRSDTRIAAEDFLPCRPFGSFGSRRGRDRLARWLTPHNKLVFLTVNRRYQHNAYIINEDSGTWDNGVWYSNTDYRPDQIDKYWWQDATDNWICPTCDEKGVIDPVALYCTVCGTCADCYEPDGSCACYSPNKTPIEPWLMDSQALA